MSRSARSTHFFNTSRDGDFSTSLGSLFQCLTIWEALLFLKVEDRLGPAWALHRKLPDSSTSQRLFFSASLAYEQALLPLFLHTVSPQQHSLLGQEPCSQSKSVSVFTLSLKPSVSPGKIPLEMYWRILRKTARLCLKFMLAPFPLKLIGRVPKFIPGTSPNITLSTTLQRWYQMKVSLCWKAFSILSACTRIAERLSTWPLAFWSHL